MPPRLREREPRKLQLGDEEVSVRVRESERAKTARLRVGPEFPLEIIVPAAMTARQIDEALEERRRWIATKLEQSRAIADRSDLGLDRPDIVWRDGRAIEIKRVDTKDHRPFAREQAGALILSGEERELAAAIERWYRREAKQAIRSEVEAEAARLRLIYKSVTVRDQKTRWGSCSSAKNLSFNWRLIIAPAEVRRYVVVHELCHLRVPNHSRRFWRLLEESMPGWRTHAAWLREHGAELRRYTVTSR